MSTSKFFQLLFLTIGILVVVMYLMSLNEKINAYLDITYYAIPAFALLSIAVYFLTEIFERQPNKGMLLNLVILNVMSKFLIAVSVVVIYYKLKEPEDGIFVLPFIIVYVIFTIFETYFMSLQAKSK